MRLKFLFFPIMIIISLFVFIGYIWPDINELSLANEEKMKTEADIEAIKVKNDAINKIEDQITNDADGSNVINNFLPSNKVEERIIADLNFLADDSSVSLVNIDLEDAKEEIAEQQTVFAASTLTQPSTDGSAPKEVKKAGVQYSQATISILGEYEKIRLFMDNLQKAKILNTVQSINIEKQKEVVSADGKQVTNANLLTAKIVVNFGWMNPVKVEGAKMDDFNSQLDQKTINLVKQYINQKGPNVESLGNSEGKNNPFIK